MANCLISMKPLFKTMGRKQKMSDQEWAALDWNRTAREIALETGMNPSRVYFYAKRLGKTLVRPTPQARAGQTLSYTVIDWSNVDWGLSNTQLARVLGCSRERVRQKRPKEVG